MGAYYEAVSPAAARGLKLDLGLQKLRNRTTQGRVFLVPHLGDGGAPAVLKEVFAPAGLAADPGLTADLASLGDALGRVTAPTFVRLLHLALGHQGGARPTIAILSEYVEGAIGSAPADPTLRCRAVRLAVLRLLEALAALTRDHGLVHGDIKPGNLLVGALDAAGAVLPVRVLDLGTGALGAMLVARGGDAQTSVGERLGNGLVCTPTAWGTPGYVPIGRFESGARPTPAGDLFGCGVAAWELLTRTRLSPPPGAPFPATRGHDARVGHHESVLRALAAETDRRRRLETALAQALPGVRDGVISAWGTLFDVWLGVGAGAPETLSADNLRDALTALPDPDVIARTILAGGAASALPESAAAAWAPGAPGTPARAGPAVPALEPGREYRAAVVLDYFGGGEARADGRALTLRHVAMLGEGAMGSVHRVEILRPGGATLPAALKLAVDDAGHHREALLREARVLRAQIRDGVAQFLALVELPGGVLGLLMSYQPGIALEKILAERRLTPAEAAALGRRLLGTLAALHADVASEESAAPGTPGAPGAPGAPGEPAQVVHGDIKPGNVIVPPDPHGRPDFGGAVLIDFGVARLRVRLAAGSGAGADGEAGAVLGGTLGYMPAGHLERGATPASDVFAVGVTLYEALAGQRPWRAPAAESYNPLGLAFALQEAMRASGPARLGWDVLPPWRHTGAWNRFFARVLGHGDPARVPPAREALAALDRVERDPAWALAVGVVAIGVALGAWAWLGRVYCPADQVRCAGVCTDLRHNQLSCGACGAACAPGQQCAEGACTLSCPAGQALCAGRCADRATDRAHCGACGAACGEGEVCSAGACTVTCGHGLTRCGGSCRDLRGDRLHCGACDRICPSGQVCSAARCVTSCGQGLSSCGGSCRDLATDRAHCGGCGVVCAGGQVCAGGRCVTSCGQGLTDCAGTCRDTQTDRAHCGACDQACAAGDECITGRCATSCGPGLALCAGRCRDVATDSTHCGACGVACPSGQRCASGRCVVTCAEGFAECGGACRDLATDRAHCGACGVVCAGGQVCAGGRCVTSCGQGLTDCAGACRDLATDRAHCGACGHACGPGDECAGGRCATACGPGLALCAGRCRDTAVDPTHCGACGHACGRDEACGAGLCRALAPPRAVPATGDAATGPPADDAAAPDALPIL